MTGENDPAPDSQSRNEHRGAAQHVVQVGSLDGDITFHPGSTWLRRRIFLAALFAVLIAGTASVIQFKFPFDFKSGVADPATTSQPKTDNSVMPPTSATRSEPAPSEPKPSPPGLGPITPTTSPSALPPQPRADSAPSTPRLAGEDSPIAIGGGNWGQIRTVSPGDYYDFIAACDGEADGQAVYALYHLVDASGFSEYHRVYDTGGPSNGCARADWRGTRYWARAVAICEEPSACSAYVYIPNANASLTAKPTS